MARYSKAIWRPTNKHGYTGDDTHLCQGVVIHSAEGLLPAMFGVLNGPRQASWHFSVTQAGPLYQHIDTANIAWTNGCYEANRKFWGIECEGGGPGLPSESLTEPQYQTLKALIAWLWETHGLTSYVRQETCWEHNELTRYGSAPTSCPSGRIPWMRLIADLEEEDDMATLDQEDRAYLAGMMRGLVRALATGQEWTSGLRGDPDYPRPEHSLAEVLAKTALTEAQVEAIVLRVLKRQKLVVE